MARIALIERKGDLAPGDQAVWDLIASSRGAVAGPFGVLLRSPEIARRLGHLGEYIRFESTLAAAERELAILAVARALDCRYEWAAHAPLARTAGVREGAIAAVRDRRAPDGLLPAEAEIVGYVTELLGGHRVPEPAFQALRQRLGERGLVELTATAGYYSMIACVLNAFEVAPEAGAEELPWP